MFVIHLLLHGATRNMTFYVCAIPISMMLFPSTFLLPFPLVAQQLFPISMHTSSLTVCRDLWKTKTAGGKCGYTQAHLEPAWVIRPWRLQLAYAYYDNVNTEPTT